MSCIYLKYCDKRIFFFILHLIYSVENKAAPAIRACNPAYAYVVMQVDLRSEMT